MSYVLRSTWTNQIKSWFKSPPSRLNNALWRRHPYSSRALYHKPLCRWRRMVWAVDYNPHNPLPHHSRLHSHSTMSPSRWSSKSHSWLGHWGCEDGYSSTHLSDCPYRWDKKLPALEVWNSSSCIASSVDKQTLLLPALRTRRSTGLESLDHIGSMARGWMTDKICGHSLIGMTPPMTKPHLTTSKPCHILSQLFSQFFTTCSWFNVHHDIGDSHNLTQWHNLQHSDNQPHLAKRTDRGSRFDFSSFFLFHMIQLSEAILWGLWAYR